MSIFDSIGESFFDSIIHASQVWEGSKMYCHTSILLHVNDRTIAIIPF
ncbi:MAG: hypothetical protein IPQ05_01380 [Leptospiraceae bacterium]|nr:hypothetical protein [Leptospiraceae bacterium]MBL0262532.1 hypothetical protein [Leptospiraceae bacterium]